MISRHTIDTRIKNACLAVKIDRISLGDLVKARYIDHLLELRKERKLSYDDIDWVQLNFREEASRDVSGDIVKVFETITGDRIILKNTSNKLKESLKDDLAKERVEDIIEKIGFQKFKNGEESFENKLVNDFVDDEDDNYQKNINKNIDENVDISTHTYKAKPKEKDKYKGNCNSKKTNRNPSIGQLALKLANFQCELNRKHKTFISNRTSENYVEAHHLIPMKYYDEFKVTIDNEANIVALCPTCHRKIHFGQPEEKEKILRKLYDANIDNLKKADIGIEWNNLLEMYKECSKNEEDN